MLTDRGDGTWVRWTLDEAQKKHKKRIENALLKRLDTQKARQSSLLDFQWVKGTLRLRFGPDSTVETAYQVCKRWVTPQPQRRQLTVEVACEPRDHGRPSALKRPAAAAVDDTGIPRNMKVRGEGWPAAQCLLAAQGYFVIEQSVDARLVSDLHGAVEKRIHHALRCYGKSCSSDFRELRQVRWDSTPDGWVDVPFGPIELIGWHKTLGGGRIFAGSFYDSPELSAVQSVFKPLCAHLFDLLAPHPNRRTSPIDLVWKQDSVSVKPPGSDALESHIDTKRLFQIIVALSDTEWVVYPRSHKCKWLHDKAGKGCGRNGYYALTRNDLATMTQQGMEAQRVAAKAGDAMVFSRLAHASPNVPRRSPARVCCYIHYERTF